MIAKKSDDDDLLEELPPLDGEAGEDAKVDVGEERLESSLEDDDPFDDEATGATPGDEEIDAIEGDALSFSEVSGDIDLGGVDLLEEDDVPRGEFEPSHMIDVASDDIKEEIWEKDDGQEGPSRDEDLLEGTELPAIDEDDDSEVDDAALFDPALLREAGREIGWDDKTWERRSEVVPRDPTDDDFDASLVPNPPSEGRVLSVALRGERIAVVIEDEGLYLSSDDGMWELTTGTDSATAVTFVGDAAVVALKRGSGAVLCVLREAGLRKVAELSDEEGGVVQLQWTGRDVYARTAAKTVVFRVD